MPFFDWNHNKNQYWDHSRGVGDTIENGILHCLYGMLGNMRADTLLGSNSLRVLPSEQVGNILDRAVRGDNIPLDNVAVCASD